MSKKFVVASDFSPLAQKALTLAFELAAAQAAQIYLVHVVETIESPDTADEETRNFHQELLEKASAKLRALASSDHIQWTARLGHRAQEILNYIEEIKPDLVFMGLNLQEEGRTRVGVSLQVLCRCNFPTVMVPPGP